MSKTQEDVTTETITVESPPVTKKATIDGRSPFGMSRKFRRALFASVRAGTATEPEVQRFQSLGKEAYPWMTFSDVIQGLKDRSMPTSKHVKLHKWQKPVEGQ